MAKKHLLLGERRSFALRQLEAINLVEIGSLLEKREEDHVPDKVRARREDRLKFLLEQNREIEQILERRASEARRLVRGLALEAATS